MEGREGERERGINMGKKEMFREIHKAKVANISNC